MAQTKAQMIQMAANRVQFLKGELAQCVNVYKVKDMLGDILDLLEFLTSGQVTQPGYNQVPGLPVAEDAGKTRVQLFRDSSAPHAGNTINAGGGDVQLIPTGTPVLGGDAGGQGQKVEFYAGPGEVTGPGGQKVEYVDGQGRPVGADGRPIVSGGPIPSIEAGGALPHAAPQAPQSPLLPD